MAKSHQVAPMGFDSIEAVCKYVALGYVVIPCVGKKPRFEGWPGLKLDECKKQFDALPNNTNIGLLLPHGVVVFDIDAHGGINGLENFQKRFPDYEPEKHNGPVAKTGGGGWHILWRLPDGFDAKPKIGKLPGVDIKTKVGQIIVEPSVHPDTGCQYEWIKPLTTAEEIPLLPERLQRFLRPSGGPQRHEQQPPPKGQPKRLQTALNNAAHVVRTAKPGSRNQTLNKEVYTLAGIVTAQGHNAETIRKPFRQAALASGLESRQIDATITSAISKGAAKPFLPENTPLNLSRKIYRKLRRKPNALALYMMILNQLRNGKCICSNYKDYGLTISKYRTAKKNLEALGLVSFHVVKGSELGAGITNQTTARKGANKTNQYCVATLLDSDVSADLETDVSQSNNALIYVPVSSIFPIGCSSLLFISSSLPPRKGCQCKKTSNDNSLIQAFVEKSIAGLPSELVASNDKALQLLAKCERAGFSTKESNEIIADTLSKYRRRVA